MSRRGGHRGESAGNGCGRRQISANSVRKWLRTRLAKAATSSRRRQASAQADTAAEGKGRRRPSKPVLAEIGAGKLISRALHRHTLLRRYQAGGRQAGLSGKSRDGRTFRKISRRAPRRSSSRASRTGVRAARRCGCSGQPGGGAAEQDVVDAAQPSSRRRRWAGARRSSRRRAATDGWRRGSAACVAQRSSARSKRQADEAEEMR